MKLSCEIIQDLLPLYVDNACSADSRKAVEEHVAQCPACRQYLQTIQQTDIIAGLTTEPEPEPIVRERVMKNGFRKLRRRWQLSVLSVFLLFPLSLVGIMGVHEYLGEGIAFTNLDEIFVAQRFMSLIEDQRFDEAAELLDFENKYQDIQNVLNLQPENYLPSFELCTVDGESWIVRNDLSEVYLIQDLCENEDSARIWDYLILNKLQNILIPESAWTQFCQRGSEAIECREAQESYFPIDTPWGRFYTDLYSLGDLTADADLTAEHLFSLMSFLPYEIYQAAQENIEQQALEHFQWNQEYYAFAADMTQEEFVQCMKDKFTQALEACYSDGFKVKNPHFTEGYRIGKKWNIEITVTLQNPTGQSAWASYCFMVRNGKLSLSSASHSAEYQEAGGDPILETFRINRP